MSAPGFNNYLKESKMENSTPNPGGNSSPEHKDGMVQRGVDSAGAAMHSTIDMVADPARSTVDRVSSAAHHTVDKLAGQAAQVADRFSDQTRWVGEAPNRALESSKDWIKERPLQAVGMALAFGYIWGRMTAN